MNKRIVWAAIVGAVVVLLWLLRKTGTATAGDVIVSQRTGGPVDTAGCPPGERMRPARGLSPAVCVPR
jgi:hypothetical protein